jgi:pimeloyl-ACP methyl ester carboxylesterase
VTPFFFGTRQRRLYGIYDPGAANGAATSRAVVFCYPWGAEYVYAHRAFRQLAKRLSLAGFYVLRFDYFGTGDSAGDMTEADLSGWENDIEVAVDELIDSTGIKRVALVGLRLGAALAASVAVRQQKVIDSLVLWDPVVFGHLYLRDLSIISNQKAGNVPIPGITEIAGEQEILGFPLTEKMAEEIKRIDLTAVLPALSTDTLILVSQRLPWHSKLQRIAKEQQKNVPLFQYADDPPVWIATSNNAGIVPVEALEIVTNWLGRCN